MAGIQIDGVNNKIDFDDDADTSISSSSDDTLLIESGGANIASITAGEFAINEGSADIDFRVESNSNTHMLFVDAGNDEIGVNTNDAEATFHVISSGTNSAGKFETNSAHGPMVILNNSRADDGSEISLRFDRADTVQGAIGTTGQGLSFWTNSSLSEKLRIGSDGHIGIGVTTTSNKVRILQDQADENCVQIEYDTSSADESVMRWFCDRAANAAWDYLQAYSNNATSADLEYQMRSAGNMSMDGTLTENGADYAEYFETVDGNAIAIGKTVVLDNGKVRASTSSDDASAIIGVVRPKEDGKISAVIGNAGWNKWHNKYLTDDFGVWVWEDYTVKEWTETINNADGTTTTKNHSYPFDAIPEGVTAPADAKELTQQRRKQNPDWDKDIEYKPRSERDEWVVIGLLGQIPISKGQKTGDRWIKMKDISDTIEEWYIR